MTYAELKINAQIKVKTKTRRSENASSGDKIYCGGEISTYVYRGRFQGQTERRSSR